MRLITGSMLLLVALTGPPLSPTSAHAQTLRLEPFDESAEDPGFRDFLKRLRLAVKRRDAEAVIALSDPDITTSFGGSGGLEELRELLTGGGAESYWKEWDTVLALGASRAGPDSFCLPYYWCADVDIPFDTFETRFVLGARVPLKEDPSDSAGTVASLNHDIVRVKDWWQHPGEWLTVELVDGRKGWLRERQLRALVDYRLVAERKDGVWRVLYFIAGD